VRWKTDPPDRHQLGSDGAVVVENIRRENRSLRLQRARDTYGILADEGIIDPTKVTRSALQNAASVAAMVLTTESLVTDIPLPPAPPAAPAPDMGGMY
jgi:chaperonin GroEL